MKMGRTLEIAMKLNERLSEIQAGVERHERGESKAALVKKAVTELGLNDEEKDVLISELLDFYNKVIDAEEGYTQMKKENQPLTEKEVNDVENFDAVYNVLVSTGVIDPDTHGPEKVKEILSKINY